MRRLVIVANWKMNLTLSEAEVLATMIRNGVSHLRHIEIIICPPTAYLYSLSETISGRVEQLSLGAQNIYYEDEGAFTGETSAPMIKKIVRYSIIGHSERRRYLGEGIGFINQKIIACLRHQITPIICVGELKKERLSPQKIITELKELLDGVKKSDYQKLIVCYEPVWAISANKNSEPASPEYASEIIRMMRQQIGLSTPIIYGGSVDAKNIAGYCKYGDIDGALVGSASLKAKEFISLCERAVESKNLTS